MRVHLLCPGDPTQRTGGYLYDARLVQGLRDRGHEVLVHPDLPEALPDGVVLADGLLWTALGERGARLAAERPVAVLLHSPLWREAGPHARIPEEQALRRAALVIATSARTAADLDVASVIVEPGTDPAPPARGSGTGRLLCVATVTPRKGHDVLLEAVRRLRVPHELRCAGSLERDTGWVAGLPEVPGVRWLGELDGPALARELDAADVVVHAARYEGWGMALAEALVRGLPVVSTPAGLFDGRDPGCRLEVPPDDPGALASALERVLGSPELRATLRERALGVPLPTWPEQVAAIEALLRGCDGSGTRRTGRSPGPPARR
ncbi:MAG: glycosyltransferase family 4 protein [Myxococcales bacterium]|nr:glycosyltransferase family 4 protein [Myxococcales bacterium]